jgi:hypothetical protein
LIPTLAEGRQESISHDRQEKFPLIYFAHYQRGKIKTSFQAGYPDSEEKGELKKLSFYYS